MGIITAVAMTIHNVPEGLAGMVAGPRVRSWGFRGSLAETGRPGIVVPPRWSNVYNEISMKMMS
jgi:hypothetical protein